MRAVTLDRYGPPEVLRIEEVEKPTAGDGEVLVRVHATTATRGDSGLRSSEYLVARLFTGVLRPKRGRIGIEFAGDVEAIGGNVAGLAPGDRVFGIAAGTNAEYVTVREQGVIAQIPDGVSYEAAACVPDGGLSGISLLRQARAATGDRVLVYGASGSIGVGAVQSAKHLGAHVTAVCSGEAIELVRTLGADDVIDYESTDFRRPGERYDVVFDAVGLQSFLRCRRSVSPGGMYITTDPGLLWHDAIVSLFTKRAKLGIVHYDKADLLVLAEMLGRGEYRPVIDRVYSLDEVVEAHRYVDTHRKIGNVVLTLGS